MTHENLLYLVAGVHGTIIVSCLVAVFQCGSYSSRFKTWLDDVDKELESLRRGIAFELAEKLKPVFEKAGSVVSEILNSEGEYIEKEARPAGSEEYRNAISDYVEKSTGKIVCWRSLHIIRQTNLFWAKYLSCGVTIAFIIEILLLVIMFTVEKGCNYSIPDKLIWGTFIIALLLVMNALLGWVFSLVYHNKGIECKS